MSEPSGGHVRLTIVTWAVYLTAAGLGLLLIPETFTDLFGMDEPREVWVRLFGVVVLLLAAYYFGAAIHRARWLYWYSVPGRILTGLGFAFLAVTEDVWQLWLFGALDILGAGWTFAALRWKPPPEPLEPSAVDPT